MNEESIFNVAFKKLDLFVDRPSGLELGLNHLFKDIAIGLFKAYLMFLWLY
jgi:hypothetical protein